MKRGKPGKLINGDSYYLISRVFSKYKHDASRRNINFDLSFDFCVTLFKGNCFYCGSLPSNTCRVPKLTSIFNYNGIDRLNNGFGYFKGNVVSCCKKCNRAKNDMDLVEFTEWLVRIKENFNEEILKC